MKYKANNELTRGCTVLGDLIVERIHLLYLLLRIRHQPPVLIARLDDILVLSLDGVPKPGKRIVPDIDGTEEVANGTHHGRDSVIVGHVTERNEPLPCLACGRSRHTRIAVGRRRTGCVGASQDGDAIVISAKAEVESSCTLVLGVLERCDRETENGGEWFLQLRNVVKEGVKREELGAGSGGTTDYRLDKGHLDVWEASPGEDRLDGDGSGNGILVEEGVGFHPNGDDERAEWFGLPGVGVGKGVNGPPLCSSRVKVPINARTDRKPCRRNIHGHKLGEPHVQCPGPQGHCGRAS